MNTRLHTISSFVLATLTLTFACNTSDSLDTEELDRQAAADEMRGTWQSSCFDGSQDPEEPLYTVAAFVNEGDHGAFTLTLYGDADCSSAIAAFTLESDQSLGALVPQAGDGVRELDILYRRITATAFVPDMAAAFEGAGCGAETYTLGEPVDISATGCFDFPTISECPGDYDIMLIENGDTFFNGMRTDNMCEPAGRPTQLNVFPFMRL